MTITLRDIDESNFGACAGMKDQPHVAPNVWSIAESKVKPRLPPADPELAQPVPLYLAPPPLYPSRQPTT